MRSLDKTKFTVLLIGSIAVTTSLVGAALYLNLKNFVFPLYMGLTLIGTVLLHKEQTIKVTDA